MNDILKSKLGLLRLDQEFNNAPIILLYSDNKAFDRLEEVAGLLGEHMGRFYELYPEAGKHPSQQMAVFDRLLNGYRESGMNSFVVTHSELILLRYFRRVRNGDIDLSKNPVSVIQVCQTRVKKHVYLREVTIDSEGDLLDPWKGGFFEEGFDERFDNKELP